METMQIIDSIGNINSILNSKQATELKNSIVGVISEISNLAIELEARRVSTLLEAYSRAGLPPQEAAEEIRLRDASVIEACLSQISQLVNLQQ